MANRWLTWIFEHSACKGSERLVLLTLADRANDAGVCWPSVADIGRRAGLSEAQARRVVHRLITNGFVALQTAGGGTRKPNVHRLIGPDAETLAPARGLEGDKARASAPGTLAPAYTNPSAGARKPLRRCKGNQQEPLENPQKRIARKSVTAVVAPKDPEADEFERLLLDRQADAKRLRGSLSPKLVAQCLRPAMKPKDGEQRRRLPGAEQERLLGLLRQVPGLDAADARDLARIAPCSEFERAVGAMSGQTIRNPGGWLRRFVTEGWET